MAAPEPPVDVVPVMAEVNLAKPKSRRTPTVHDAEQSSRGVSVVALSLVCAALAIVCVTLLVHSAIADRQRRDLACQVQLLGGEPVGGVHCPKPSGSASPSPSPGNGEPDIIVVPGPTSIVIPVPTPGPAQPSSARTPAASSSPAPRPAASRRPSPTPSPTCSPVPVVNRCLP